MLYQKESLNERTLESVSGGKFLGKGVNREILTSADPASKWICPRCQSDKKTVTTFDEGGIKIECDLCHYTVYE